MGTKINIPNAEITFISSFLSEEESHLLFEDLMNGVEWKQDSITIYGKTHLVPRLHQWYGDAGLTYKWSGIAMHPIPWTSSLEKIKEQIEEKAKVKFNSLLLNLYRDGEDTVGWHADNEPELGKNPTIASLSLGAMRDFKLRHNKTKQKESITLTNGSLLIMGGETQHNWEHSVPRRKRVHEPRINLTFRNLLSDF